MNKAEFLDQLRLSLNGRVEARQVEDILRYYEEYIDSQMGDGVTEEEVMRSLGAPRLIARSIVDAGKGFSDDGTWNDRGQEERRQSTRRTENEQSYASRDRERMPFAFHVFAAPGWVKGVIAISILLFVIALILIVLKFLLPLILIFVILGFVARLFHRLN